MPAGVPVLTTAIGIAGAKNAALGAISILALHDEALRNHYLAYRQSMAEQVRMNQFHE